MRIFKFITLLFLTFFVLSSCEDNDDKIYDTPSNLEAQDFIWKGLNQFYLWQEDVPNLSDSKFASQTQLDAFLTGYSEPETLFQSLLNKPVSLYPKAGEAIDRFSWIVDDYLELEQALGGISKNNGVDFGLYLKAEGSTEVFGWVRYILPNSDASEKDIKRGDIFTAINGTQLTTSNYRNLLALENHTLNLATYNGTDFMLNGKSVALTKTVLAENPIFINKVIESGSHKIGYLMYNGFYGEYDSELNEAFSSMKLKGITDLVLDLRYNSGGSVLTATRLASMITGQFTGQIFAKQQWSPKMNALYEAKNPSSLKNLFTDKIEETAINSLKMTTIYILTSKSSASASELVINGLKPYITVVQIGDKTTGKNVGSRTVYDSPTYGTENRNPNHRYAMQPITFKIINATGFGDYQNGLIPTHEIKETLSTLGVLGSPTEPLLSTAIGKIIGSGKMVKQTQGKTFDYFEDRKSINGLQNQMYLE
jgi:C-terminal processing protease CtpA/Prc